MPSPRASSRRASTSSSPTPTSTRATRRNARSSSSSRSGTTGSGGTQPWATSVRRSANGSSANPWHEQRKLRVRQSGGSSLWPVPTHVRPQLGPHLPEHPRVRRDSGRRENAMPRTTPPNFGRVDGALRERPDVRPDTRCTGDSGAPRRAGHVRRLTARIGISNRFRHLPRRRI